MMKWKRITQKLDPDGSTTGDVRKCPDCGNYVDRREDHKPGCTCHRTVLCRSTAEGGSTDRDWCEALCQGLVRAGFKARVVDGNRRIWVERWL